MFSNKLFCSWIVDDVDERLALLVHYVCETWIDSQLWPASTWSAFQSSVWTNNDVEGWHNLVNRKTRSGKLDVYQLAPVLYREVVFVDVHAVLIHEWRLKCYQPRTYRVALLGTGVATLRWDRWRAECVEPSCRVQSTALTLLFLQKNFCHFFCSTGCMLHVII